MTKKYPLLFTYVLLLISTLFAAEIHVHYDTGPGNYISIRGEIPALGWEIGKPATWTEGNVWILKTPSEQGGFVFKPLLNDQKWSIGGNYQVPSGDSVVHIFPFFLRKKGEIVIKNGFSSEILQNSRAIRIFLPPSYHENQAKHYPVLYMHDGQNLFDPATSAFGVEWQVDETLEQLIVAGKVPEVIVVGIDNTGLHRTEEYTSEPDPNYGGGNGENYLHFIQQELMPYINRNYRTLTGKSNTFLMGSSLGGLISFHAGWTRDNRYGAVGCLSSSFWWNNQSFVQRVEQHSGALPKVRFYIDAGGVKDGAEETEQMRQALIRLGYVAGENLMHHYDAKGKHNEASWASRLHIPLQFLLGKWR